MKGDRGLMDPFHKEVIKRVCFSVRKGYRNWFLVGVVASLFLLCLVIMGGFIPTLIRLSYLGLATILGGLAGYAVGKTTATALQEQTPAYTSIPGGLLIAVMFSWIIGMVVSANLGSFEGIAVMAYYGFPVMTLLGGAAYLTISRFEREVGGEIYSHYLFGGWMWLIFP